jgi:hypothetical protein
MLQNHLPVQHPQQRGLDKAGGLAGEQLFFTRADTTETSCATQGCMAMLCLVKHPQPHTVMAYSLVYSSVTAAKVLPTQQSKDGFHQATV